MKQKQVSYRCAFHFHFGWNRNFSNTKERRQNRGIDRRNRTRRFFFGRQINLVFEKIIQKFSEKILEILFKNSFQIGFFRLFPAGIFSMILRQVLEIEDFGATLNSLGFYMLTVILGKIRFIRIKNQIYQNQFELQILTSNLTDNPIQ